MTLAKSLHGHLKVHKIENFFDSDFRICIISLLVMSKYSVADPDPGSGIRDWVLF